MENVFQYIVEKQYLPSRMDVHNNLSEIKHQIIKHQERETLSHLLSLKEIYKKEVEYCQKYATPDNYYSDILPSKIDKYEKLKKLTQEIFSNLENGN